MRRREVDEVPVKGIRGRLGLSAVDVPGTEDLPANAGAFLDAIGIGRLTHSAASSC
jgi:hypothetical protein